MKIKKLSEETEFTISVRTLIAFVVGLSTLIGVWFELKYDILEAKELPATVITRAEYDLQIKDLEKDLEDIKQQIRIASEHFLHGDFEDDN